MYMVATELGQMRLEVRFQHQILRFCIVELVVGSGVYSYQRRFSS